SDLPEKYVEATGAVRDVGDRLVIWSDGSFAVVTEIRGEWRNRKLFGRSGFRKRRAAGGSPPDDGQCQQQHSGSDPRQTSGTFHPLNGRPGPRGFLQEAAKIETEVA